MRRWVTILLLLVLGVGPLAAALPGNDESSLPACCRRLGAHHCAMAAQLLRQMFQGEPGFSAPAHCSSYPAVAPATVIPGHALVTAAAAVPSESSLRIGFAAGVRNATSQILSARSVRGPPPQSID